jgi:hypothetical protein
MSGINDKRRRNQPRAVVTHYLQTTMKLASKESVVFRDE